MELLITSDEIASLAFGGAENVDTQMLSDAVILAVQNKFIKPVLGNKLYDSVLTGRYAELLDVYIKPALAMYVKFAVLPSVSAQVGTLGVVRYSGESFSPADDAVLKRLIQRVRTEADTLMDAAVKHIELQPLSYPEYDSQGNVRNRVSIAGGIVL